MSVLYLKSLNPVVINPYTTFDNTYSLQTSFQVYYVAPGWQNSNKAIRHTCNSIVQLSLPQEIIKSHSTGCWEYLQQQSKDRIQND